jgi:AraC-like DNA-binding protein
MTSRLAGPQLSYFSTEHLPETDRVGIWREVYGRTILRLDIEPLSDRPLQADIRMCTLPGLGLVSGIIHGVRDRRTSALIADGNDDFGLMVNRGGGVAVAQCGREATLGDGDAILLSCGDPAAVTRPSACHYLGLRVPRLALAPIVRNIEDLVALPIPRGSPGLGLLRSYVTGLLSNIDSLASSTLQRLAAGHVYDLLALILAGQNDGAVVADSGGVRAARLHAIKTDIVERLRSHGLTISTVAARNGLTPRYIQRLFEHEGTSFTSFVLAERLALAHRMLNDRRQADSAISAIAFEAGFGDLSYFNRAFRRHYGATPSDVRAQARPDEIGRGGLPLPVRRSSG